MDTEGLTFDDVLLQPQHSDIESRSEISLETQITPLRSLQVPLLAANMDTVCEAEMATALMRVGGLGVIHRYLTVAEQCAEVKKVVHTSDTWHHPAPIAAAIGVKELDYTVRAPALLDAGANILVIDVAHGDHTLVVRTLENLQQFRGLPSRDGLPMEVIAGNVATATGTRTLINAGADAVKVGIGPGSLCTTRVVTGHGVPQLTAIQRARSVTPYIIADGGIRHSGDIVKALAFGASAVMIGSLFAGTTEAPGELMHIGESEQPFKLYRGMASFDAQERFFGTGGMAPEGVARSVPYVGAVAGVIQRLIAGTASGLSYAGARTIEELQESLWWDRVSAASVVESLPHGVR